MSMMGRLAKEPPFRLLVRAAVRHLPFSVQTKAKWDAVARPNYLVGVLYAASQAREEGIEEVSVIEFGVAGGAGLITLQKYAIAAERETGVRITVWGFDTGKGLPNLCGDYRDHPDRYLQGEYSMDEATLSRHLGPRTRLVLGNIAETVPRFVSQGAHPPVGFMAVDLDLYSSTREALKLLDLPGKRMLRRVPLYFDDVDSSVHHRWAGELLAIQEFNESSETVRIDRWRGLENGRPFPEQSWLKRMYMAHDLAAISSAEPPQSARDLPLTCAADRT